MFSPDDLKMVKEGPSYRRRFLDILICQLHSSYLYDLQNYYKILNQRNNLLKQIKFMSNIEYTLDVWDEKLAEVGSKIIEKRLAFVKKIAEKGSNIHKSIALNEKLNIKYACSFISKNDEDLKNNEIYENFYKAILQSRDKDIKRGFTNEGPHRDDLKFLINDLDIEKFGSQGQQRTVVLSLKLAELDILEEEVQDKPILLLDDVFSELDENRRDYLKHYIRDYQVFITSTDKEEIVNQNEDFHTLKVVNGSVSED
jgi:DNA replication and repair protein RecF